jgi:hypothetical protein
LVGSGNSESTVQTYFRYTSELLFYLGGLFIGLH